MLYVICYVMVGQWLARFEFLCHTVDVHRYMVNEFKTREKEIRKKCAAFSF